MKTEEKPRSEFGHQRTICDCAEDRTNCQVIPGYLIPADLPRLAEALGYTDIFECAKAHLLASPGALVEKDHRLFRIPTIVPARDRATGYCRFLTAGESCAIHRAAPYGCSFFDVHMPPHIADRRSSDGLKAILADQEQNGMYIRVWAMLDRLGKRAPAPETQRAAMAAALAQITRR